MNNDNSNTSNENHNDKNRTNNYIQQTDETPSTSQYGIIYQYNTF